METYCEPIDEDYGIEQIQKTSNINKDSLADQTYEDLEKMDVMIRSEGLVWEENLLLIWGTKFPKDRVLAEKVIHHAMLVVDNLASKGNYRIIYFHSNVKSTKNKIPKLIKKLCGKMSATMRSKMRSFDIIHPTFTLKLSLFFFDKITFTNYKIHYIEDLDDLYERIEQDQKTFILTWMPAEIKLYDAEK